MRLFYFISLTILLLTTCRQEKSKTTTENIKPLYPQDELTVQHGQELFVTHCASCHSMEENNIGPNLSGVTNTMDKEWLLNFIKNPVAVINSGDAWATAQYKKYKQYMPPFAHLKPEEVDHILSFIHKFSEGEKKTKNNRTGALLDPIKEKIPQSDISLVIEKWLTIPPSGDAPLLTRINKMHDLKLKNSHRLFLLDLRGKIYELVKDSAQVYFDVRKELPHFIDKPGFATGLGSFTFHPDFETNGLLYTIHTEPDSTAIADFPLPSGIKTSVQYILTEWKTSKPLSKTFDLQSKREIIRVDMNTMIHGCQDIQFNPNVKKGDADYGNLYVGVGDGGAAVPGHPEVCNPNYIWGKVIRINPLGSDSKNGKYGIPKDNPYYTTPATLKEIWLSGFRNPHIITWDRTPNGIMLVSNIGQHSIEEINIGIKGGHYGWPQREGSFLFDVDANPEVVYAAPANDTLYTAPAIQFDHDEGNAVSAGYIYRGKIRAIKDKYIFGDIPRGTMFYTEASDLRPGNQAAIKKLKIEYEGKISDLDSISGGSRVDLRLGMDLSGELYIFTKGNGNVYKVVNAK